MGMKFTSRLSTFLQFVDNNLTSSLEELGRLGVEEINAETPVRTGDLKASNSSLVEGNDLYFYNSKHYAVYVEFGTYKMYANPFMRRGMNNLRAKSGSILLKHLGVGE